MTVMSIPANMLYYTATEASREKIRREIYGRLPSTPPILVDFIQSFLTALVADCLFQAVYTPGEVVAARMIVQNQATRLSLVDTVRSILHEHGTKGLYRGYSATLLTSICSSSIWWCSYSASRRTFGGLCTSEEDAVYVDALCGMVSGGIETVGTHPFDTLRARIMTGATRHSSILPALRSVVQKDGVGSLWRGLYPSLCQSLWSSAVFAVAYELIKRSANRNNVAIGFGDDD